MSCKYKKIPVSYDSIYFEFFFALFLLYVT